MRAVEHLVENHALDCHDKAKEGCGQARNEQQPLAGSVLVKVWLVEICAWHVMG